MQYSQFLTWAMSHLGVLTALFSLVQTLVGGTLEEKAAALKAIIDTLLPVVKDFPTFTAQSVDGVNVPALESAVLSALAAQPSAQGVDMAAWDGKRLRFIFETLAPLLPVLIGLLK